MVAPTPNHRSRKTRAIGIPTIDLSLERSELSELIVKACEEFGFFKVVNHRVSQGTITKLEKESIGFFAKPTPLKQHAGPATPFGYGCKNIGPNGDMGELEYLLLQSDPSSVADRSMTISDEPAKFSSVVNDYIRAVKDVASEILDLVCDGLPLSDGTAFSRLIRDAQNDSLLRINHYPGNKGLKPQWDPPIQVDQLSHSHGRIGFGEHSDPQIITILRSNDVEGLQICLPDGLWVPVSPDPDQFYVMVGDVLEVMTNGRFTSIRHRAILSNLAKSRMSMMYFAAPSLSSRIAPHPEMISPERPCLYKSFTWGEYKRALYSMRLADCRLDNFKVQGNVNQDENTHKTFD